MNIQENISLKALNTFGIDKKARFFVEVQTKDDVIHALKTAKAQGWTVYILGGGSNILLTQDIDALVIKINIKGINVIREDDDHVWVKVGAGEIWHDFVLHAISQNWAGIENLSLIPGTVGASPMQNIGAYGVEIKEVFDTLEAVDRDSLEHVLFHHRDCRFGYRESIFKHDAKDRYVITHVTYKLRKNPRYNISYGAIAETLSHMGIDQDNLSLKAISKAVIHIRQSKLPDPKITGNAGSFFKNPTVDQAVYEALKEKHPEIPGYPQPLGVKIPAAWLIEKAGWKGKTFGEIGVHKKQPLVLVNYGKGDGAAIKELAEKIQTDIQSKFGIALHPEVNFI